MTRDIVIFTILLIGLIAYIVRRRLQEGKKLRSRILDSISPALREEIEQEREENREKKRRFEEAMKKASEVTNLR